MGQALDGSATTTEAFWPLIVLASAARLEGPRLVLRLIEPEDANYLHALRTNRSYNEHLSEVRGTAEDQTRWIEAYKAREAEGRELYYVIERKDGTRCGVVRLYDIGAESFTWGSWILDHNKPPKAALESALLSFGAGFETLGLQRAFLDVRIANTRARAFYDRLSLREFARSERDIFLTYHRLSYRADRDRLLTILLDEQEA